MTNIIQLFNTITNCTVTQVNIVKLFLVPKRLLKA